MYVYIHVYMYNVCMYTCVYNSGPVTWNCNVCPSTVWSHSLQPTGRRGKQSQPQPLFLPVSSPLCGRGSVEEEVLEWCGSTSQPLLAVVFGHSLAAVGRVDRYCHLHTHTHTHNRQMLHTLEHYRSAYKQHACRMHIIAGTYMYNVQIIVGVDNTKSSGNHDKKPYAKQLTFNFDYCIANLYMYMYTTVCS